MDGFRTQQDHAIWLLEFVGAAEKAGLIDGPVTTIPPWLLESNYIPPDRSQPLYILNAIALVIAVYTVIVRVYTRVFISKNFGRDDGFIVGALIISGAFNTLQFCFALYGGVGKHMYDISPRQISVFFKLLWFHLLGYFLVVFVIKLSILYLIKRIIPADHKLQRVTHFMFGVYMVFFIAAELLFGFECGFTRGAMNIDYRITNRPKCIDLKVMVYVFGGIHVVLDIALLCLPMVIVWRLDVPKRKRITTGLMFAFGFLACICQIMRLRSLHPVLAGGDGTWHFFEPGMWVVSEIMLGVISASIPPSKQFYQVLLASVTSYARPASSHGRKSINEIARRGHSGFHVMPSTRDHELEETVRQATFTKREPSVVDITTPNRSIASSSRIAPFEDLEKATKAGRPEMIHNYSNRSMSFSSTVGTFGQMTPKIYETRASMWPVGTWYVDE